MGCERAFQDPIATRLANNGPGGWLAGRLRPTSTSHHGQAQAGLGPGKYQRGAQAPPSPNNSPMPVTLQIPQMAAGVKTPPAYAR